MQAVTLESNGQVRQFWISLLKALFSCQSRQGRSLKKANGCGEKWNGRVKKETNNSAD